MRRSIPLLIVVLAVQLGLAALLASRRNPLASIPPQSPLIGASAQTADHLLLEGGGSGNESGRVEITRRNGQWLLPGYFNAPADQQKVNGLLGQLVTLQRGLPIATSRAAMDRFKVADDNFERRLTLSQGARTLDTLYIGTSTGARRTDARTANDRAVYSVDLGSYQLPTQSSAWFAQDLLQRDATSLSALDVMMPQGSVHLLHAGTPKPSWSTPDLPRGRQLDTAKVDALASAIGGIRPQGILGTAAQPDWRQNQPVLTLTLHTTHDSQSWVMSQTQAGNGYVLKSSSQPWYFSLSADAGRELLADAAPATLIIDPAAVAKAAAAATAAANPADTTRPRTLTIRHLAKPRKLPPGTKSSTSTRG
jgi:hypothetical protein